MRQLKGFLLKDAGIGHIQYVACRQRTNEQRLEESVSPPCPCCPTGPVEQVALRDDTLKPN